VKPFVMLFVCVKLFVMLFVKLFVSVFVILLVIVLASPGFVLTVTDFVDKEIDLEGLENDLVVLTTFSSEPSFCAALQKLNFPLELEALVELEATLDELIEDGVEVVDGVAGLDLITPLVGARENKLRWVNGKRRTP
jgi:hypothetical protein